MLDPSSETRGQIVGARESLNGREKMAQRKVKYGVVPYFSSLRAVIFFSRPFRRSLAPTISSWVSEDVLDQEPLSRPCIRELH